MVEGRRDSIIGDTRPCVLCGAPAAQGHRAELDRGGGGRPL